MQHWILRCKHCQKEYTYCTYGNGPEYGTEEGCSQEYCAECQKAIDEALSKITVKCIPIPIEVDEPDMFPILDNIKKEYGKNNIVSLNFVNSSFDNFDRYTYKGNTYHIGYNDDTPEDKHLFIDYEFDLINKKTTNKRWKAKTNKDTYMHGINLCRIMPKDGLKAQNLPKPEGTIFYHELNINSK